MSLIRCLALSSCLWLPFPSTAAPAQALQAEKAKPTPKPTVLDRDHEFDVGSKITLPATSLTPTQIENLATLGRVWGFLKYHHPKVTTGQLHWDYELFRVMPFVLAAADRASANDALAQWIDRLGELKPGPNPPLPPAAELYMGPDLAWLDDRPALGARLSEKLRAVHVARPGGESQFYVSPLPGAGYLVFDHEPAYASLKFPDAGYRLLALFRFWNIVRYWAPYRDQVEGDWNTTLAEFIPRLAQAADAGDYQRTLFALIARIRDTHANLLGGFTELPPVGDCTLPALIRFVEGRATVVHVIIVPGNPSPAFQRGDVILALGGTPVETLVAEHSPYYSASNEAARLRDLGRFLARGPAGQVAVRLQRGDAPLNLKMTRVPMAAAPDVKMFSYEIPGPAFRLLSPDIAYLKLSAVKVAETLSYVRQAAGTKGWIIDLRNYPAESIANPLGAHFVARRTEFARFTVASIDNPGALALTPPTAIQPQAPRYAGKIVLLVNETTQSQAEFTAMAFRSAPGVVVVGSTTAGADGNVSAFSLPGGAQTRLSGVGVFYSDKRPTQRIGIVADVEAHPTVAGIRAGRDEVLEAGLRQILGPEKSHEEIRKLIPDRER